MASDGQPVPDEQPLEEAVRSIVFAEVERLGPNLAAERLDLTPTGVQRLMWARDLSLAEALRVADQLGLPVRQEMTRTVAESTT